MILIWFIVWVICGVPSIAPAWDNGWFISMVLCILMSLGGSD